MRGLLIPIFFILTLNAVAQPTQRFLLNQIPYVPEQAATNDSPLLNTQYQLRSLEPLPRLQLPQELPVEFHPDPAYRNVFELYTAASASLAKNDTATAVRLMEEAMNLKPDTIAVQVMYADSLLSNKQYAAAKSAYERILTLQPTQFQSLNNLAWMLATVHDDDIYDPERALRLINRARLVQPRSHFIWSTLSEAQFALGQYQEAEQSISIALDLANGSGVPVRALVNYLMKRDYYTLAREATSIVE